MYKCDILENFSSSRLTEINNAENLQRMAAGSLHEMSFDPQAALYLGQVQGVVDKIRALNAHGINEKTGM